MINNRSLKQHTAHSVIFANKNAKQSQVRLNRKIRKQASTY